MNPKFVNRERELKWLEAIYRKKGKQLAILFGRRRTGKTELLNHFSKNRDSIYFLADKRGTLSNTERFARIAAEQFNDILPEAKNFDDAFAYIKKRVNKKKIIVIIDEFSYLVEKDASIPSVFQLVFDEIMKNTNIFLILCGSSISMMYKGTLSYESPLYGRRTGEWKLNPMRFKDLKKFFPKLSFEQLIEFYAICGGIPAYAIQFTEKNIFENIKRKILKKGEFLYNEPEILLKEELKQPSSYFSILEAMTKTAKLTNIANRAKIPAKDLPKYLKTLEKLEIIYKERPLTEEKSKKTLYFIKDNFFKFWFNFIYPKKSELESNETEKILKFIKKDFNSFVSQTFELICKEFVEEKKLGSFEKTGRWWSYFREENKRKREEIDIVAFNENKKTILFAECKWSEKVNAEKVLKSLKEKAEKFQWNKNKRNEIYAIFAKSFRKKPREKCLLIDTSKMSKEMK